MFTAAGADLVDREQRLDPLDAVRGEDPDVVAGLHAEIGERVREPGRALVELAVGDLAARVDEREPVGHLVDGELEQVGEVVVARGHPAENRTRSTPRGEPLRRSGQGYPRRRSAAAARSSSTRSGPSTPQTQPFSDDSQTCMRMRATRTSRSVAARRSGAWIALVMIAGHDLGDAPDDVGVLDLRGAERAHHRRGDVGVLAQRPVRAAQHRHDPRRGCRPRGAGARRGTRAGRPAARPSPRAAAVPSTRSSGRRCRARRRPRPRRRASAPRRNPPSAASCSVASSTRRRRAAWLRASAPSGAGSGSGSAMTTSGIGTRSDFRRKRADFRPTPTRQVERSGHGAARAGRQAVHGRVADRGPPSVRVERGDGRGPARASRSWTPSPTRPRSTPPTAWSWSTRAASSTPSRCTTRSARGRTARSTPRCSPTATSTTSSASTSTRRRRAPTAGRAPRVVAHTAIAERFERYRMTAGYNAVINQRQFKAPGLRWPTEYRMPDETYSDTLAITVGGETFELHHDRGETDDATWVWSPARKVLFAGDMFIWASPNCGNPQKAQRYARDWAIAFRKMAALEPEMLLPGHGLPIVGAARVRRALTEGAELLESLVEQTLALMNEGARLDDIVADRARARAPARTAVPARRVRRARVRRPQPLAPLRRLVRRRPVAPQARARGRTRPRARRPRRRRGAARGPCARGRGRPATCASPGISPSWPRRPRPTTRACTRPGPRCSGPGPRRGVDDVEGHLLVGRARVATKLEPRP